MHGTVAEGQELATAWQAKPLSRSLRPPGRRNPCQGVAAGLAVAEGAAELGAAELGAGVCVACGVAVALGVPVGAGVALEPGCGVAAGVGVASAFLAGLPPKNV